MNLQVKAILAGLCFGIWPLIMNKSGLYGFTSALLMCGVSFICLLPFAWKTNIVGNINWSYGLIASIVASVGIMFFNDMLAKVDSRNVSQFIILMVLFQTLVPMLYYVFQNGGINSIKLLGFFFAIFSIILINISD